MLEALQSMVEGTTTKAKRGILEKNILLALTSWWEGDED
jgi:hypothetical protein